MEMAAHAQLEALLALPFKSGVIAPTPPLFVGENTLLALAGNTLVEGIFYLFPIKLQGILHIRCVEISTMSNKI
jgi:hypothetical protein